MSMEQRKIDIKRWISAAALAFTPAAMTACGDFADTVVDVANAPGEAIGDALPDENWGCIGTPEDFTFVIQRLNNGTGRGFDYSAEYNPKTGEFCELKIDAIKEEFVSLSCGDINKSHTDEAMAIRSLGPSIDTHCQNGLKEPWPASSAPSDSASDIQEYASNNREMCTGFTQELVYGVQSQSRTDTTGHIVTRFVVFKPETSEVKGGLRTYDLLSHEVMEEPEQSQLNTLFRRPDSLSYIQNFCNTPRP